MARATITRADEILQLPVMNEAALHQSCIERKFLMLKQIQSYKLKVISFSLLQQKTNNLLGCLVCNNICLNNLYLFLLTKKNFGAIKFGLIDSYFIRNRFSVFSILIRSKNHHLTGNTD